MISVHSCVRGRMLVHLPEEWRFAVHSCVRGKIPVHLLEGWWCGCMHVWGVGFRWFTWGVTISDHSSVRGKILVHLLEGWWFRCLHVWGVRYQSFFLRGDDFDTFMCEGSDSGAFTWGMMISVHSCMGGRISVHSHEKWWFAVHSCVRGKTSVHSL